MSLEDQIRRMGDARAAEVHTPEAVAAATNTDSRYFAARIGVAAAAVALIAAGIALFASLSDDDNNTVAGNPTSDEDIRHWIPSAGGEITSVQYGTTPAVGFFATPGQENALISTPEDATDPVDDDWTWVSIDGPTLFLLSENNDPTPSDGPDGKSTFAYRTEEGSDIVVQSRRFDAADIRNHETALRVLGPDIAAIAAEIASWDDGVEVVFAGDAAAPDLTVATDDTQDGGFLLRIDERDPARFAATYRWALDDPGEAVSDMFALEGEGTLNASYATYDPTEPTEVTGDQWMAIIQRLIGTEPAVQVRLGGADSARAIVSEYDGHHTVALDLVPTTATVADDTGLVGFAIGSGDGSGVELVFEPDPSATPGRLIVRSRMSAEEAQLFADLLNIELSESASSTTSPTTTTESTSTSTTSTTPVQTGICADYPVPTDEVLDIATHISANRTPLDLDQDGIDDEMLIYDDADGNWFLIARLQAGWTNAIGLGSDTVPELISGPNGSPAAFDLDEDGGLEFLVTGTSAWGGGVQFMIWMDPDAAESDHAQIRVDLDQPAIRSYEYVDQQATYEEFREIFADVPEMLEVVDADQLPSSYRVTPESSDPDSVGDLVNQFEGQAGVRDVTSADPNTRRIRGLADELMQRAQFEGDAIVVSLRECALNRG
ncbi:MAG: permease-like cell division protein FtsX [Acidimicrobiales bacterium]